MKLRTTLEQWATLLEVDRAGSIQAAAKRLNKSHTTLIYALRKLEDHVGVALVQVQGRRAVLTDDGKALLRRAAAILEQTEDLEAIGSQLAQGMESEVVVTIDHLCLRSWLYAPLATFAAQHKGTSVKVLETSLSATHEAVVAQKADIAIIPIPIANHLADVFGQVTLVPIVAPSHPLADKAEVCGEDLLTATQIVVRDLGQDGFLPAQDVGWLKSQQRLTVDNFDHALDAVMAGVGFCRVPTTLLTGCVAERVVQIPLRDGACYQVPLHLTLPKARRTGPAARALYDLLLQSGRERLAVYR